MCKEDMPVFIDAGSVPEDEIRCDWPHCLFGLGVAGMGICHRDGGDPRQAFCSVFEQNREA